MLIGTHIFCEFSPLNWFESANIDDIVSELDSVVSNGFNCVFLIIPCAPIIYDTEQKSALLITILKEARYRQLEVHIRACYLWESGIYPNSTYHILSQAMHQPAEHQLLVRYFEILRTCIDCSDNPVVKVFISWEDFYWPIFRHWPLLNESERADIAHRAGYVQFVHALCLTSTPMIIPPSNDVSISIFISFFDTILLPRILRLAKEIIGAIGYEYRIDSDELPKEAEDTHRKFYHWQRSQLYVDQSYIYFHQNIGGPGSKNLSGEDAALNLRNLLRTIAPMFRHGEQLPIIDQFNFIDSTENSWSALKKDASTFDAFFKKSLEIINESSSGVVLWSYRDWPKDIVFNGKFRYGDKGWETYGELNFDENNGIIAMSGAKLLQRFNLELNDTKFVTIRIIASPLGSLSASLSVAYGDNAVNTACYGEDITLKLPFCTNNLITIKVIKGSVKISQVSVYDRIYSQGGKSIKDETTESSEAFLAFSKSLSRKSN
ncbi:hypothetical protein H7F10_15240 [Acidithiobacillus sp. HP-6]|uniref:hypothetical protein n=1 Tax=unclassified Acidithiobacillus TaxID=2614800 RepID=UPI00187919F6|nr:MULTISPECIES: hypothetical protein [unclassified Acidithiobacillus]MBE7564252.1 hypothetical protein [Acidithiobacillus sp. HP-6]MBE7570897.1 hypothetical protein [Acidithiobacillus sp. HP-2]